MELPDLSMNLQKVNCPKCGYELPMIRKPESIGQALLGGWTCDQCNSQIDKWGKLVKESDSSANS